MRDKNKRQDALMAILKASPPRSQQEIVRRLRMAGLEVTQASVSRDVRELGLVKVNGEYVRANRVIPSSPAPSEQEPASELIIGVEPVGANLVVVHTEAGAASSVGVVLDGKRLPEVAGTVAGDDTIFVAVRSRADQGRLISWLKGWARPSPSRHAATESGT